jgi:hypothetical protein
MPRFLFYPDTHFKKLRNTLQSRLVLINGVLDQRIIFSAMFMVLHAHMYYHLSSTHPDYYRCAPINAILAAAAKYGREHGCEWLHLGGGLTVLANDPLYQFKRSFGRLPENGKIFYVAHKVWNQLIFEEAKQISGCDVREPFFPPYRGKSAYSP